MHKVCQWRMKKSSMSIYNPSQIKFVPLYNLTETPASIILGYNYIITFLVNYSSPCQDTFGFSDINLYVTDFELIWGYIWYSGFLLFIMTAFQRVSHIFLVWGGRSWPPCTAVALEWSTVQWNGQILFCLPLANLCTPLSSLKWCCGIPYNQKSR